MTTPNNSEGIIHANWPDNMVPVAVRIEIPSAYQGCPCEVICYKSN